MPPRSTAASANYAALPEVILHGLRLADPTANATLLRNYAPLPAARGDFLFRAGRHGEAKVAFEAAAALTGNARERDFLLGRAAACAD